MGRAMKFTKVYKADFGVKAFDVIIHGKVIGSCYKERHGAWNADNKAFTDILFDKSGKHSWVNAPIIEHANDYQQYLTQMFFRMNNKKLKK